MTFSAKKVGIITSIVLATLLAVVLLPHPSNSILVQGLRATGILAPINSEIPVLTKPIDAATLAGKSGLYYLDAANLTGVIDPKRFSAYDSLVAEGKIDSGSVIQTDKNSTPTPSSTSSNLDEELDGLRVEMAQEYVSSVEAGLGLAGGGGSGATQLNVVPGEGIIIQNDQVVAVLGDSIDLLSEVAGVLAIANGGTGLSAPLPAGKILTSNGSGYAAGTLAAGDGVSLQVSGSTYTYEVDSTVCRTSGNCSGSGGSIVGGGSAGQLAFFTDGSTLSSGAGLAWNSGTSRLTITGSINSTGGYLVNGVSLSTSHVLEGSNLYYTQGRFDTAFGNKTTTNLAEGTGLYWTNTRFDSRLATKSTSDLVEGSRLYYTDVRVSANTDVAANTAARHAATTILDSATLNLSIVGQQISGSVIQSGLQTSLLNNDAGFITNLSGFDSDDLAEGATNWFFTTGRFDSAFAGKDTDDLAEGIANFYFTDGRFDTAFGNKDSDDLAEGATNQFFTALRFDTAFSFKTTTDLAEGTNLYYTEGRVSANTDVVANTAARHVAATVTDTTTVDLTLLGQDIAASVIQANLQTSLLNNDAGFITGLGSFDSDDLAEGATNLYYTALRFDTAFGGKTTDDLAEGVTNLYFSDTLVSANADVAANTAARHAAATVLDSATLDLSITGQQISGSVIQSGLQTSLMNNDAGFIANLSGFDTDDLAEGVSNFYFTSGRFDAQLATKDTDDLTEGTTNLYSQWANNTTNITFGNSVGIGAATAPTTTLDVTGTLKVSGAVTLSNFAINGGILYTNGSGVVAQLSAGGSGQCLVSNGAGSAPSWAGCADSGTLTGSGSTGQLAYFSSASSLSGSATLVWNDVDGEFEVDGDVDVTGGYLVNGSPITTDEVAEGVAALYWTNARFDSRLATKDTDDIAEGITNLYYTDTRVSANADVAANTAARHAAATVSDSSTLDLTLVGQQISGSVIQSGLQTSLLNNDAGFIANLSGFDSDDLAEGLVNLYYTEGRVSANTDVAANTAARHTAATVLDSTTINFTLTGQQVTGVVIQSAIQTSQLNNDAGFIVNLTGFDTDDLAEGVTNKYYSDALFSTSLALRDTDDLAEGATNLYYTTGRFDTDFGGKDTDDLAEGLTNLYSQWANNTTNITFGNSVGIGAATAPTATLDLTGSFKASGAITLSSFTANGGVLYTNGSGVVAQTTVGGAGECLKSAGGGAPTWGSCATTSAVTGSGVAGQVAFFDSSSNIAGDTSLTWNSTTNVLSVNGSISMTGDIIPSADDTYSLGSSTFMWQDVYIGPGSLYINGQKVLQESGESIVVSADPGQNLSLTTAGGGDLELTAAGGGVIQLKSNVQITGGNSISTSDTTAVLMPNGLRAGNIQITGNTVTTTNLNGDIAFTPNGVGDSYFTTGNLGVGNSNPGHRLDVTGSINASTGYLLNGVALSTTNIAEGTNLYYTQGRFDTAFSGKTTDNLTEGTTALYWTNARFDSRLATKETDDLAEGTTNLYYTDTRVSANTDVAANTAARHAAATVVDSATLDLTLTGQQISGTVIQSGLQTSLLNNDAGFVVNLSTFDTDDLAEGATNKYWSQALFDAAFGAKSTTNLAEGTNLYYTQARFDSALGAKTTDSLAEGTTNKYFTTVNFDAAFDTKDTDDLTEGVVNLYYTSTRFTADFGTKDTDDLAEGTTNKYYSDALFGASLATRDSDDIAEGVTNLYFTQGNFDTAFDGKTTDDLTEGAVALYWTDGRFDSRLATKDSDDITEGATNLYYTDIRVSANADVAANTAARHAAATVSDSATLDLSLVGQQISGSVIQSGLQTSLLNNDAGFIVNLTGFDTDDLAEGTTNRYFSDALFGTSFATRDTDDLAEGITNLYYTQGRFDSAFSGKSTTSLSEGTNLYWTQLRFDNAFTAKDTDDLSEGLTNLYYTQARFDASLATKDADDIAEGTTNQYFTALRFDTAFDGKTTDDLTEGVTALYWTDGRFDSRLATKDTDDVAEGTSNLYYTDTRVSANTDVAANTAARHAAATILDSATLDLSIVGQQISGSVIQSGLQTSLLNNDAGFIVNLVGFDTDDLAEGVTNKYFTDALFGTSFSTRDTDDLAEGVANLYYTSARFDASLATKDADDIAEGATNKYFTTVNFDAAFGAKDSDDLPEGVVNLYYTSGRFNTDFSTKDTDDLAEGITNKYYSDALFGASLATRDSDDVAQGVTNLYFTQGNFDTAFDGKTTDDLTEGATALYWTDGRFDSRLATKDSDDIAEGATNLYYTDTRVSANTDVAANTAARHAAATVSDSTTLDLTIVGQLISGTVIQSGLQTSLLNNDAGFITNLSTFDTDDLAEGATNKYWSQALFDAAFGAKSTTNLAEGTNLYYTSARFTTDFNTKTTDNLTEGTTNKYFTTVNFDAAFNAKDTDDLTEGVVNLYYTSARFTADFGTKDTDDLAEGTTNKYYSDALFGASLATRDSDDVAQGVTNLYFTQGNFDTAFDGKTTDDLTEGAVALYWTDGRFDSRLATKDTDDLAEGATNLYYTDTRVSANADVAANTAARHAAATVSDSSTLDLTLVGQQISGSVIQSGLQTSLLNNDAGFIVNLTGFDTDDLAEGTTNRYFSDALFGTSLATRDTDDLAEGLTNLYYTTARFDTDFGTKTTTDLAEGTNLYWTTLRFDTAFSGKDTDDLAEGVTNLYYSDALVSANSDVAANTAARHSAATVLDSSTIDFSISGQQISGSVLADSLNFTEFADAMTLDASTSIAAAYNQGLSISASMSGGSRSTSAFSVTQTNDVTNNLSGAVVTFTNQDTSSISQAVLKIDQQAPSGVGITIGGSRNTDGFIFDTGSAGYGTSFGAYLNSSSAAPFAGGAFYGTLNRSYASAGTFNEGGLLLQLSRSGGSSDAGVTLNITNPAASISSNCAQTAGSCNDATNVLRLTQSYANATGAVLGITGAGTGNLATLDATNASANGLLVDVQSNSASQYALRATFNNGATVGLEVAGNGQITLGTFATDGGVLYTNGSGVVAQTTAGSSGQCLQSNAGGAPTWGTCYSIATDSLDFDDFADALTLDASTSIALGSNTLSTSGTGGITFNHTGDTSFAGEVGIGQAPSVMLDVMKTGNNDPIARFGSAGTTDSQAIQVYNGSGSLKLFTAGTTGSFLAGTTQGDSGIQYSAGDDFHIGEFGVGSQFTIKSGGNVGIGTAAPEAKLEVATPYTVTGSELVTNGSFTSDASGWTLDDCASWGSGQVTVLYSSCDNAWISTSIAVTAGETYVLTFDSVSNGDNVTAYFDSSSSGSISSVDGGFPTGTHSAFIKAAATGTLSMSFESWNWSLGTGWSLDNVSIKEIEYSPTLVLKDISGEKVVNFSGDALGNYGIGRSALNENSAGGSNIAFGDFALESLTTGYNNSAIGKAALRLNTTGSYNIGLGTWALDDNTTGSYNIGIGLSVLNSKSTASNNIAIGNYSQNGSGTGTYNTSLGHLSLNQVGNGSYNTGLGSYSMAQATTGSYNTGIGYESGRYNQTGNNNVFIGYQAGRGTSNHNKSGNVFIGYQAGYNETGSNLLYIDNSNTASPLIYGDFTNDALTVNGSLTVTGVANIANLGSSASTTEGSIYYDTDDDQLKVYANGKWQADRSPVTKIVAASDSQNKEKADYVADGTADDVEIQAAINALPAGGGSVVLLDGNYSITTAISITKDNTKIVGQGTNTSLSRSNSGNILTIAGTSGDHVTDVAISSLKISGPSVVGAQVTGSGIYLDYTDRVVIDGISGSGFGSVESDGAIAIVRSTYCTVQNSNLSASKNGIVTGLATDISYTVSHCTIHNNRAFSNYDDGIHTQHSSLIAITSNHAYDNGTSGGDSAGIDTLGDVNDTIAGNVVTGTTQKGIEVGNSTSVGVPDSGHTITGNTVSDNGTDGILIANNAEEITISSNTSRNNGGHGISLGTSSTTREVVDSMVIGNIVTGNGTDGIRLTGNSHRNTVVDNVALSNSNRGMSITVASTETPDANVVEHNRFASNTVAQFSNAGTNTIIRFNVGTTFDIQVNNGDTALDVDGTLTASGAVTFSSFTTDGGILYTNGSGVLAQTTAGSAGECLQSNAGGAPTWGSCGGGVTADSLDFDDFADALTLDASTSINLGANTLSTSGTGGITFGHTGTTSFAGKVGLGTTNPDTAAHIVGDLTARAKSSPTKLASPSGVLAGNGNGTTFSPDGTYMVMAHNTTPYIDIYKRSGDTFTKLSDPASLPAGNAYGATFSSDGTYLAIAHSGSPYLTIYKRSGDTFTKLSDPASLPTGQANSVHFSTADTYLTVGHNTSPYVTIYKRSGDTFTKLSDPASLPPGNTFSVRFSADGTYLATGHNGTPFLTIYKRSGDTFTKLSDPASLPTGNGQGVSFSSNSTYLAIAHNSSPYISIYKRSGDTFTKLSDPASLPAGNGFATAFSADNNYVVVGHNTTPFLTIYKRSGDTFTKLSDPASLPAGNTNGVAFSLDGRYISVAHISSPYQSVYKFETGSADLEGSLNVGSLYVSGQVTLQNLSQPGGVLFTNSGGGVSQTTSGTAGQCLQSNAGGAPSWGSCGGGVAADSLDFDDFADALTLDASTSIDLGSNTLSTSGTGGITFDHTGSTTFAGNVDIAGVLSTNNSTGGSVQFYSDTDAWWWIDNDGGTLRFSSAASPTDTNAVIISSAGYVGIGDDTGDPEFPLDVEGTIKVGGDTQGSILLQPSDGGAWFWMDNTTGDYMRISSGASATDTNALVITSAGSVGIGGDTTPNALFSVGSSSQFQVDSSGAITQIAGTAGTKLTITSSKVSLEYNASSVRVANNGAVSFVINGSENLINTSTGLAIGTLNITNTNNNSVLKFTDNGSANQLTIANAAASGTPSISATGTDTNISLQLSGKGTGKVIVAGNGLTISSLTTDGGVLYTDTSGNVSQTTTGSAGQCLQSNAGGAPTWGSCGGGSSLFTDGGTYAYLTVDSDDFVLGDSTVAGASFYFDESAGNLYLGTDELLNGGLTFYSSGTGETDPSIMADALGNLILSAPSGTVQIGDGTGNIELVLETAADSFLADKTVTLSGAYSGSDFNFTRNITAGSNALSGAVFTIEDTSSVDVLTSADVLLINQAVSASTGNLLRLQFGGADRFKVGATGVVTIGNGSDTVVIDYLGGGLDLNGAARPTKVLTIAPEYPNATFITAGTGTNDGTMTTENTNSSASSYRNYYEWASTNASLQDYTIAVRVTLPQDFDAWDTSAFALYYQTGTSSTADNAISATITESTQASADCSLTDQQSTTWTSTNMTCANSAFTNWNAAGETALIKVKVKAKNTASALARVGEMVLRYKAKF